MPDRYRADGTIHVRLNAKGKTEIVTFTPEKCVEQGGGKFVVFVPWADNNEQLQEGSIGRLVVKGAQVDLCAAGLEALLPAAVHNVKVTVVVSACKGMSRCKGQLKLHEVVVPAVPTNRTTR